MFALWVARLRGVYLNVGRGLLMAVHELENNTKARETDSSGIKAVDEPR
jgi:hypothetical protein